MRLRSRAAMDYEARLRSGGIERFHESVPERHEAFAKAIARAERARVLAEDEARTTAAELGPRGGSVVARPFQKESARALLAAWKWLVAWLYVLFSRAATPAALPERPSALETRARDAALQLPKATAHRATLEAERDRYIVERRRSFFAAIRGFADDLSRGGELLELTIDVPSTDIPSGIVLVSAPEIPSYDGIDGCIVVTADAHTARTRFAGALDALGATVTRTLSPRASPADVRRALEEIKRAAALALGERAVSLARRFIGSAVDGSSRAEAQCHARIVALESQRLTDPDEFRARSMERMDAAIADGVRQVLRGALERLSPRPERLKAEWRAALLACADRRAVEACVQSLREGAPPRINALVDELNDFVVQEMQRVSDTMQLWLLEELHARYQLARRQSMGDAPAPVITDAASGEFAALDCGPLADAMGAFEQSRVRYGLGGAAAGAVLGTLIAPVIGTAIGAFLGVFAGLFRNVESLKQDCVAGIEACVDESAQQLRAQLESRQANLAGALRASLEESLDTAMQRFAQSIARLMELERETLAVEREKLARLAELHASLEHQEARFAALAEQARASRPPHR